jgi:hypothetical protein
VATRRAPALTTEVVAAVARRPRLWPAALRQARALSPRGWWRRPPFVPLPPPAYLAFRLETQYGDPGHRPEPADVVRYLAWCQRYREHRQ